MPDPAVWEKPRRRFTLPFVLGVFAGLALGFGGGLAFMTMRLSRSSEELEEWKYPGATGGSSAGVGGGGMFGAGGIARVMVQQSADGYDDVVRYYAGKAVFNRFNVSGSVGGMSVQARSGMGVDNVLYADGATGGQRGARVQTLARRMAHGTIVIVISRAEKDDQTHIVLYWLPRM